MTEEQFLAESSKKEQCAFRFVLHLAREMEAGTEKNSGYKKEDLYKVVIREHKKLEEWRKKNDPVQD